MQNTIKFKIKRKKKGFILFIYSVNKFFTIQFPDISKNKMFNFYYIIMFLIKFGIINVYL